MSGPPASVSPSTSEPRCPDCESPAGGTYCPNCGQRQGPLHVSLLELFHDWVDEFLHFDSKLVHTIGPLVVRPGFLTVEYIRGRRTRYLRPFRLWFTVTVAFFILMSLVPSAAATGHIHVGPTDRPKPGLTEEPSKSGDAAGASWSDRLGKHFQKLEAEDDAQVAQQLQKTSADYGPNLVLLLVPVFALLLKLFYWRAPLGEHFVFSFHLHAFHALVAIALMLVECSPYIREHVQILQLAPFAVLTVYQPLALRRVYRQGWIRTLLKSVTLGTAYLITWGLLQGAFLVLTALQA